MVCKADMSMHLVMTAKNLIEYSKTKDIRSEKFSLLGQANEYLNEAEKNGVGAETLRELRVSIIDQYLEDYLANKY